MRVANLQGRLSLLTEDGAIDVAGVSGGWHTHLKILADRLDGHLPQPFWPVFNHLLARYEQHAQG